MKRDLIVVNWKHVKKTMNDHMQDNECVVLAISGGVDSMVLLEVARSKLDPNHFAVAHFNHHIRDTDQEEHLVREYCETHNLICHIGHGVDLKGDENQARTQRWAFLEDIASQYNCNAIVTAHHKNDLIENFILQIMRGNHILSCPMQEKIEKNGFIRLKPFLDITKEELIKHAHYRNVQWFEDETNQNNDYTRNLVRNIIIPEMMKDRNVLTSIPKTIQSVLSLKPEK